MSCKYCVVVLIDGGGKKGFILFCILFWLEEELNYFVFKSYLLFWVDVYLVISMGVIIVGVLVISGFGGKLYYFFEIVDLYLNCGYYFFDLLKSK